MADAARLADETEARMAAITGLAPFSSPAFARRRWRPAVAADGPEEAATDLMAGWSIEIPCFDWQDNTIARISTAGYTTRAEADLLVTALSELLTLPRAA